MPPASSRPPSAFARVLFSALLAAVLVAVAVAVWGSREPSIPIPDGVPPPPGTALPAIDVEGPGRTAALLRDWAAPQADALGIPVIALEAYGHSAAVLAGSDPGCGLAWTTLAGIGSVESRHGRHAGASLGPDGTATPEIRGVPLDGGPGLAEIRDTDGGRLDGDPVLDRAMGPMQFIPETWVRWGVDANGDGVADPDNIDDAALSAGRYLCDRGGDLTTAEGWTRALMAYNLSGEYLTLVRDRASAYGVGVRP
ncbi:lytic transglycosylase domain-containing protein [Rhodococcus chondri]|uniref:Lytic murein transglycosylase n=1 Tax=Rhodococcus chondri TaxID=3065941 RepID=A0ABU7JPC4_9NOCA|nr:lytic murein transglycosylase [Rhodococcus sp. CC-R104]MEE2031878.1 lytic murein transglycosylase [Rhodococcus sp. CC-R104]